MVSPRLPEGIAEALAYERDPSVYYLREILQALRVGGVYGHNDSPVERLRAPGSMALVRNLLRVESNPLSVPGLADVIHPEIDLLSVMARAGGDLVSGVDVSGSGFVAIATVPPEEFWILTQAVLPSTSSSCRLAVVIGGTTIRIGRARTAETNFTFNIKLDPGDQFGATGTGNGGDSSRNFNYTCTKYPYA